MNRSIHTIKSQIVEVSFNVESEGLNFQKRLSDLLRNEMALITEKCLSKFDSDDILYINRLEVDLGDIPYQSFQKRILEIYEEKLLQALLKKLQYPDDTRKVTKDREENHVDLIRHFLIKGYMPWNFSETRFGSFDGVFAHSLEFCPEDLIRELNSLLKSESIRSRLIHQLEEKSLTSLIRKIEPAHAEFIIAYHTDWLGINRSESLFKSSENELSKSFWKILFNYLYEERGSYFNTRSFLISTLHHIAARFGVAFAVLLVMLRKSYQGLSVLGIRSELNTLIQDILSEYDSGDQAETLKKEEPAQLGLKDILYFLKTGKWQDSTGSSAKHMIALIHYYISHHPSEMVDFVKTVSAEEDHLLRLVENIPDEVIVSIIEVLQPSNYKQIQAYHGLIVNADQDKSLTIHSGALPKVAWMVILSLLVQSHGSGFNHKVFIRSLIHKMANRFNSSYELLLARLRQSLQSIQLPGSLVQSIGLINQIFMEDIGEASVQVVPLGIEAYDPAWIEESILSGSLHRVFLKEGFHTLTDFFKFYYAQDSSGMMEFISNRVSSEDFLARMLAVLDDDLVRLIGARSKSKHLADWHQIFRSVDQISDSHVVSGRAHQKLLKAFLFRWMFRKSEESPAAFETELIKASSYYGIDFNGLLKTFMRVAGISKDQPLIKTLMLISEKYCIPTDGKVAIQEAEEQHENSDPPHIQKLISILFMAMDGIVDRRGLTALGFRSVDELLTFLIRQYPQEIKNAFASASLNVGPYPGIGREISLTTFYSLIMNLDVYYGRSVTHLLRILEIQLDGSSQTINRFLSAARSMVLYHITKSTFNTNRFLSDFSNLITDLSPNAYVSVMPVISKKISALSLPAQGNAEEAIANLESHLSDLFVGSNYRADKLTVKQILAEEFFNGQLEKESTVVPYFEESKSVVYDEIYIENAGLVIVGFYLPVLLERCGLTLNGKFKSPEHQEKAVLLLQFLMMDTPPLDEHHLPLNKILCGFPVEKPITTDLKLSENEMKLVHGLIEAMINHWTAIGKSSVEGFRGSWLWRKGKLEHKEESWELRVEQHGYDMLMDQIPFTLSPVKYSWMNKPLIVNWR